MNIGCRLHDRKLVRLLTEEAAEQARVLEGLGAKVNFAISPIPAEPQMRYPRSLSVPGKEILITLKRHLKALNTVTLLGDHHAIRLLTREGEVIGAVLFNVRKETILVRLFQKRGMSNG